MNAFELRERAVGSYRDYIRSFVEIHDKTVEKKVEETLDEGLLWPPPLIQLNPSFELAETVEDLVEEGLLHSECGRIFRSRSKPGEAGTSLRLYRHQVQALRSALAGHNYVLTTGTGSGKSLAYIIPAVDHILKRGSGKGIQAIIVYPMNALANSQLGELSKFITDSYPDSRPPATFARYTGQEGDADRDFLRKCPPDILLTNYVMLELLLTRPYDKALVRKAQDLRFLVLDELHTYRGRQGADVAMLARRTREALTASNMQCVGTSATLAGAGSLADQQREVAQVASLLFGAKVKPENVIGETLTRVTPEPDLESDEFRARLRQRLALGSQGVPRDYKTFIEDPLSMWIESAFGVASEPAGGRLARVVPRPIEGKDGAAEELSRLVAQPVEACAEAVRTQLQASYHCRPAAGLSHGACAFRLHQFISRGDTVYASPEPEEERYSTLSPQRFVPGNRKRVLLPLVFCRECGQDFYTVSLQPTSEGRRFSPRRLSDSAKDEDSYPGFLYISTDNPWPAGEAQQMERVPDDWLEDHRGSQQIRRDRRKDLPELLHLAANGVETDKDSGTPAWFIPTPFRFCPRCGVAYDPRQSDFAKLTPLATEGRSSATTILSLAVVEYLRGASDLEARARKLLSFTDNRQDASLQAGHFNDFIEVTLLRSALYAATKLAGPSGLRHEVVVDKVLEALDLPFEIYATDPMVKFAGVAETKRALRAVVGYRLYRDLKHGWRVTLPNLEQCGLLEIDYLSLRELCADESEWAALHPALAEARPDAREVVCKTLLDIMRRRLAIKVDCLDRTRQEQIKDLSVQRLREPWALDEGEEMESASILFPRSRKTGDSGAHLYLSNRSGFARYLARPSTFPGRQGKLTLTDKSNIIADLLRALRVAGLVEEIAPVPDSGEDTDVPGYQLQAAGMVWKAGDGNKAFWDPVRVPRPSEGGGRTNPFFVRHYADQGRQAVGLEAREHTAQVSAEDRQAREEAFRKADLPILFCSPTMELGVDISQLNVVSLRNVPPTPANYAQRSGRAGRGGQPAFVYSYCSTASSHDQYFFRRPQKMVAGQVAPPRLDLTNEDLIRSHVHAIWLAETGVDLGHSLGDVLDVTGENPSLKLLPSIAEAFRSTGSRERTRRRTEAVLKTILPELEAADWYRSDWLDSVLAQVELQFDKACDRWRSLYRAAESQRNLQHGIIGDASRPLVDRQRAKRLRAEAESQRDLLIHSERSGENDFYSYRYFASEGFLPGYSFPRLPLSAYIPGRRDKRGRNEFLSRPRFLAISEFGPRAVIYHEGAQYMAGRVILPVRGEEQEIVTTSAKQCEVCGYLHPAASNSNGPDVCERCEVPLGPPLTLMFRLQNVTTWRRTRISSDEEERMRLGYEIRTGVRFVEHGGQPAYRTARVSLDGVSLFSLTYGDAATIWRINLGWARRSNRSQYGFVLDTERGVWAKGEHETAGGPDEPMSGKHQRVIPYVEDRRNCLLIEPCSPMSESAVAGLQAALKTAIQLEYQLEDSELAAEPLPSRDTRHLILLYEAAEGGAGVLRHLIDDSKAIGRVARSALEICHFDPETGEDRRRAENASEDCEAACYDCLMSYTNQMDHLLLDRQLILGTLTDLAHARVEVSPSPQTRLVHLQNLSEQCESDLEKKWLKFVLDHDLRLPSQAQVFIAGCQTRPDFLYDKELAAIYVDGPPHDYPERQARDHQQTRCMEDMGYIVIRFVHTDDWRAVTARYPEIFGRSP